MQLQDAPATYLFKLWPWIEANKIRLIGAGGIILVVAGLISFHSWQRNQKEITASLALTQLMMSDPHSASSGQQADQFLKIARDYQNTTAGERALLQSATMLFAAGNYADAQKQFQEFLSQYPGSFFAAQAALGMATSLDAQGKTDLAADAYQQIINTYADVMAANLARYGLAQINEHQGKVTEAINHYEDIVRSNPNSPLSSEAGLRVMELKMKPSSASPATAPAAPFKLNP
jgi:TolA-binding protein